MKVVDTSFIVVGGVERSCRSGRYTIVTTPVSGNIASRISALFEHAATYIATEVVA